MSGEEEEVGIRIGSDDNKHTQVISCKGMRVQEAVLNFRLSNSRDCNLTAQDAFLLGQMYREDLIANGEDVEIMTESRYSLKTKKVY